MQCKVDSSNPSSFQNDQTKIAVTVPDDITAELYCISVFDSTDTSIYFENVKSRTVQISVPSNIASHLVVNAYSNNTLVYTGTADIQAGQTDVALVRFVEVVIETPESVSSEVTSDNMVILSWSASSNATFYYVQKATDVPENWFEVGGTSDLGYVDTEVAAGGTYYYRIIADDGNGKQSEPTDYVEVVIPAAE